MTLRGYLRLVAAGLLLPFYLVMLGISRLFGGSGQIWVRRFLGVVGRLLGLRARLIGTPATGQVLIVANHISWLDILALGGVAPVRFIAKAEIARWPLVGWLASISKAVFVARERRSAVRLQADAVTKALRDPVPVVLFAEGGTGDGLSLGSFRASLFASAVEAGAMVQPVAIDYGPGRARLAWPSGSRFGPEAKRLLNRRGSVPVTIRFLPPLDSSQMDRKALAVAAHAAISSVLT